MFIRVKTCPDTKIIRKVKKVHWNKKPQIVLYYLVSNENNPL